MSGTLYMHMLLCNILVLTTLTGNNEIVVTVMMKKIHIREIPLSTSAEVNGCSVYGTVQMTLTCINLM